MPTTIVNDFKTATNDLDHSERCRDSRCSLSLHEVPEPYVLIRVDSAGNPPPEVSSRQRCDYLFVGGNDEGEGPWVIPVELTTGRSKSGSDILGQLNGGLAVANARLRQGIRFQFRPVVAHGPGGLGRIATDYLRNRSNMVNFRGKRERVAIVPCGSGLVSALNA